MQCLMKNGNHISTFSLQLFPQCLRTDLHFYFSADLWGFSSHLGYHFVNTSSSAIFPQIKKNGHFERKLGIWWWGKCSACSLMPRERIYKPNELSDLLAQYLGVAWNNGRCFLSQELAFSCVPPKLWTVLSLVIWLFQNGVNHHSWSTLLSWIYPFIEFTLCLSSVTSSEVLSHFQQLLDIKWAGKQNDWVILRKRADFLNFPKFLPLDFMSLYFICEDPWNYNCWG